MEKRLSLVVKGRCSHRLFTHVQTLLEGGKVSDWSQIHVLINYGVNG